MFGRRFSLFRLFGISIGIDFSWFFIALLITWSLAAGFFPGLYPHLSAATYWTMGVVGALGLFASIILHELGHALAARRFGIPIKAVTLFIFGGVAQMDDEPPNARSEFVMAIAGPIVSVLLAFLFGGLAMLARAMEVGASVAGVLAYLGWINGILVLFNLVPAFPLDGGRVLRSALWAWKKDFRRATGIASGFGSAFGIFLIIVGIAVFIGGNFISGLWWALIGLFLRGASQMSYQHALLREALRGEPVARFMKRDPVVVEPSLPLSELVDDYIYGFHHKEFPVVEDGHLLGCVGTREIRTISREEWPKLTVRDVASECDKTNTIASDEDAIEALKLMNRSKNTRLLVTDDGHLEGIVTLKDLLSFLSVKLDLEGDERGARQAAMGAQA